MAGNSNDKGVLVRGGGLLAVEATSPLVRNQWFDGKFLKAEDLDREQRYQALVGRLSAHAGGFGVVRGLDVSLSGERLDVAAGLAIAPRGDLVLLTTPVSVDVGALIAGSGGSDGVEVKTDPALAEFCGCEEARAPEVVPVGEGDALYRLSLCRAEVACGHENVYGSLCEQACVADSKRPLRVAGALLRAVRVDVALADLPKTDVGAETQQLRSRYASALFRAEDARLPPYPDDGDALRQGPWCAGATVNDADCDVTLGYLLRRGGTTLFLDMWSGRRERMTTQPEHFWRYRTRQRPLENFFAQVAQFQCQLASALGATKDREAPRGPCADARDAVASLEAALEKLRDAYEATAKLLADNPDIADARESLAKRFDTELRAALERIAKAQAAGSGTARRLLIEGGLLELPPAGYLPVSQGAGDVETQVRLLLGEGVDLRVCTAPIDAFGLLFEQGRHSARTSLLEGLAEPTRKPTLQILVPDGVFEGEADLPSGHGWRVRMTQGTAMSLLEGLRIAGATGIAKLGELLRPLFFTLAAPEMGLARTRQNGERRRLTAVVNGVGPEYPPSLGRSPDLTDAATTSTLDEDVFSLAPGAAARFTLEHRTAVRSEETGDTTIEFDLFGSLNVRAHLTPGSAGLGDSLPAGAEIVRARCTLGGTVRVRIQPADAQAGDASQVDEVSEQVHRILDVYLIRAVSAGRTVHEVRVGSPTSGAQFALRCTFDPTTQVAVLGVALDGAVYEQPALHLMGDAAQPEAPAAMAANAPDAPAAPAAPAAPDAPAASMREHLVINRGGGDRGIVAEATVDAGVLARGSVARAVAQTGLGRLEAAFADPGYAKGMEALLFDDLDAAVRRRVTAKHDWILFRRPIAPNCGAEIASAPVRVVRYGVAVIGARNFDLAQIALEELLTGKLVVGGQFGDLAGRLVTEYAGEGLVPQSPPDLLGAFRTAGYGGLVVGGVFVPAPASDGSVERQRVESLVRALQALAVPRRARFEERPGVDAALTMSGTDGTFVFVVAPTDNFVENRVVPVVPVTPPEAPTTPVVPVAPLLGENAGAHLVLLNISGLREQRIELGGLVEGPTIEAGKLDAVLDDAARTRRILRVGNLPPQKVSELADAIHELLKKFGDQLGAKLTLDGKPLVYQTAPGGAQVGRELAQKLLHVLGVASAIPATPTGFPLVMGQGPASIVELFATQTE